MSSSDAADKANNEIIDGDYDRKISLPQPQMPVTPNATVVSNNGTDAEQGDWLSVWQDLWYFWNV